MRNLIYLTIVLASLCTVSYGAKILGVFPTMAKSHYIVGSALMKGLAEKGHEVTVISPFPQAKPLKNFRDIPTPGVIEKTKVIMDNIINMRDQSVFESLTHLFGMGLTLTNMTFEEPNVQKLINSNEKFDLVIMEVFVNEAHLGFAHKFKCPVIGVSTFGANMWNSDMVGSPSPLSYVPSPFIPLTDKMNLLQRIGNILVTFFERTYNDFVYLPQQAAIYKHNFPDKNGPCLYELRKNVSLILLNNHFSVSYPRPYVPNMVEVGGMHINRKTKPLPADLQKFLDEAKDGVVYFSMGSNLKSRTLPKEKRDVLLNTFRSLKQKVLWKWEDKELPGKPNNVFISDWFPQDDVLAHPNVKAFITHGGLLSTMEAIYHGKPVIGIPMFGDQFLNMARAEQAGFGITVDYNTLSEQTLGEALKKVLSTNKYEIEIKEISKRYKDQPMNPLDTAIYWVEYVLRHKGAVHLKSAGQNLAPYQYHNLDAFAVIFGAIFLVIYLTICMLRKCFGLICGSSSSEKKTKVSQKKKKN